MSGGLLTRTYVFRYQAPAGESGNLRLEVPRPGTVTEVVVRFPPGPAMDLLLRPYVARHRNVIQDIFAYEGEKGIRGDNELLVFKELSIPVEKEEALNVYYQNDDGAYPHWVVVYVTVDHALRTGNLAKGGAV